MTSKYDEIPLPVAIDGYVRNIIELSVAIKEMSGVDDYVVKLLKESLQDIRNQLANAVESRGDVVNLSVFSGGTH